MDNLKERLEISRLLAKELVGTIREDEREKLDRWLAASPLHRQELDELRNALENGDEAWNVQRRGEQITDYRWECFKRQNIKKRKLWHEWGKYAALFFLPLLAGIYFLGDWKKEDQLISARENAITPGTMKAQLVMSDGQRVELEKGSQLHIQDSSGTEIQTSGNMVKYSGADSLMELPRKIQQHTLIVPQGGEYALQLADGTKVWLNAGSTLRYPVYFKGTERKVEMTGEAYFEVARNQKMPFIVTVNGVDVRVLGTSFNVSAYQNQVITTLVEGRVQLKHGTDSLMLLPDQQAIWQNGGSAFEVREVDARNFILWKDGLFYFDDAELGDILEELSRWYNVNIFYANPDLKSMRFTMKIKRYENIDKILQRIGQTKRVQFEVKNKTISVYE